MKWQVCLSDCFCHERVDLFLQGQGRSGGLYKKSFWFPTHLLNDSTLVWYSIYAPVHAGDLSVSCCTASILCSLFYVFSLCLNWWLWCCAAGGWPMLWQQDVWSGQVAVQQCIQLRSPGHHSCPPRGVPGGSWRSAQSQQHKDMERSEFGFAGWFGTL